MWWFFSFQKSNLVLVKFPQILKVLRASSVEGLSLVGFVTELATQTVTFSYNSARGFPFRSVINCRQSCRWQRFMKIHNAPPPPPIPLPIYTPPPLSHYTFCSGPHEIQSGPRISEYHMSRALFPSKHSGDAVVPRRTEKFQDNPFSRYSFFSPCIIRGTGKYDHGEVFSSLVLVRAHGAG